MWCSVVCVTSQHKWGGTEQLNLVTGVKSVEKGAEQLASFPTHNSSRFLCNHPSSNPPVGKTLTTNLRPQRHPTSPYPHDDAHGRRSPSDTTGLRSDAQLTNTEPNPGRTAAPERYKPPIMPQDMPPKGGYEPVQYKVRPAALLWRMVS